jgi:UDP-N-acetylglucosamine 3-dehydrogenase
MLRAALLGLGAMGRNHARVLRSLEGVRLVAVHDPAIQGQIDSSEAQVLGTVAEVLSKGIDYCVIATPTATHEELAVALMSEGVHVLIEKPISISYESARRISECASKNGVLAAVGHIERYNAAIRQLRVRILSGDLGQIYQVVTRRQGPFPSRIGDVGVVMDLATHDIDTTRWVTQLDYSHVSAHASVRSDRLHEDLIAVTGLLNDDVVVNHIVNWISPMKERKTIFTGERGTLVVDTLTTELSYYSNGRHTVSQPQLAHFKGVTQGDIHIYAFDKPEPLLLEHQNFRDAVNGLNADIVSLEEATETIKVAEAIVLSATTKKSISR